MLNVKWWGFPLAYFPFKTSIPTLKNLKIFKKATTKSCQTSKRRNLFEFGNVSLEISNLPTRKKKETAPDRKGKTAELGTWGISS